MGKIKCSFHRFGQFWSFTNSLSHLFVFRGLNLLF